MRTFLPTETCPHTCTMLRHVFGTHEVAVQPINAAMPLIVEAATLGLDYVKLLVSNVQNLPVLVLDAEERGTGRTTFAQWLISIAAPAGSCFESRERWLLPISDYGKGVARLIVLDETLIDSELLASLKEHITRTDKHAQLVIATHFGQLDDLDDRAWHVSLSAISNVDVDLYKLLMSERRAFMDFLLQYNVLSPKASRTWFAPELLRTHMAGQ